MKETESDFCKTIINIKLSWPLRRNFPLVFLFRKTSENKNFPNVRDETVREMRARERGILLINHRSIASVGQQRLWKSHTLVILSCPQASQP